MKYTITQLVILTAMVFACLCFFVACSKDSNKPDTPTGITLTQDGSTVIVSWNQVNDAVTYNIYIESRSRDQIGTTTGTSFTDVTIPNGTSSRRYQVTAVNHRGESDASSWASIDFLNAPSNLSASQNVSTVVVRWNRVRLASSSFYTPVYSNVYIVYRSNSALGEYTAIGETSGLEANTSATSTEARSFADSSPLVGNNFYRVSSVDGNVESGQSAYIMGTFIPIPTNIEVTQIGTSNLITWSPVAEATNYRVYRSSSDTEDARSYTSMGTPVDTFFIDANPSNTGINFYQIATVNDLGEGRSARVSIARIVAPTGVNATQTQNELSITVWWNAVAGATGYKVYRSNSATGTFTEIGETNNINFTDPDPLSIMNYYRVTAISIGGESVPSIVVSRNFIQLPDVPSNLFGIQEGSYFYLNWSHAFTIGQGSYRVYRSSSATGTYNLHGSTTDRNYRASIQGYYKVSSVNLAGESEMSEYISVEFLGPPTIEAMQNGSSNVISWNAVTGATNYRIFRSSTTSGTYSIIGTVNGTSFTDDSPLSSSFYRVTTVHSQGSSWQSNTASVTTRLAAPTNVATSLSGQTIVVTWNAVTNATGYKVYRSSSATGTFTVIGELTTRSFTDPAPLAGNNSYLVTAVNSDGGESVQSSVVSRVFAPTPDVPTNVSVSQSGSSHVVTWSAVAGASGYRVYRRSGSTLFSQISGAGGTSYTDNSPLTGQNYYSVTAVNTIGGVTAESALSAIATLTHLSAPTNLTTTQSSQTIEVSWAVVTGATSFRVYRSSTNTGIFTAIGESNVTSFTDTNPLEGNNSYQVVAIGATGESVQSSAVSINYVSLPNPPTNLRVEQLNDGYYFLFAGVPQNYHYRLYRSSSAEGTYSFIGIYGTMILQNYAPAGTSYFKVSAVNIAGESELSEYFSITFLDAPTNIVASQNGSSMTITWDAVTGATGYRVFHVVGSSGTEIGTTNTTSFTHNTPGAGAAGTNRSYRIVALSDTGENTSVLVPYTFLGTPSTISASQSGSSVNVSWGNVSGALSYIIYRSSSALGEYTAIGATSNNSTNFTDANPLAGNNFYKVSAANNTVEGGQSEYRMVNFTP